MKGDTAEFHGELLSLVHELKNHLLVIQGSVGLVQQRPAALGEVLELAGDIDEASRRADHVLSALQRAVRQQQSSND